ncbi:MFS transporter [Mesorhizobium koreense]|uniref:MFS transporter n=1 Tax=Mesorhizobium koreense TaxID=3074855 RepID=UPI00287B6A72|nr:MFS transporter [Mesorhizobium sp. WR6]
MATQVQHPIWLPAVPRRGARTFAALYAVESFARASISSVIPIQAYDLLHNEQEVSLLYTLVALLGLSVTLSMPLLIERFARRWVYTAGASGLIIGSAFLVTQSLPGQMLGMLFRVMGASALSITLNLYIMDYIRKQEFMQSESLRMAWSTLAWTCGPFLGVYLYTRFGLFAAHGVVALFATILLALFWHFRLGDNELIRPGRIQPQNPLKNIGRFVRQPRLRLAWVIAFGRSCFWSTFFVYVPILMVATGEGKLIGGLFVSAGNLLLFFALFWGRAGQRFGARRVIAFAFMMLALFLFAAAAAGEAHPLLAGVFLLCCALFVIAVDALGSTVYMRAVRMRERPQMTAVYRTYIDLSDLTPPLVYSIVLAFSGLGGVFAALGVFISVCCWLTWRYVPRAM